MTMNVVGVTMRPTGQRRQACCDACAGLISLIVLWGEDQVDLSHSLSDTIRNGRDERPLRLNLQVLQADGQHAARS